MKLLLTSTGLTNESLTEKFIEMVRKKPEELTVAYIPTAANVARPPDKHWVINNFIELHNMKVRTIDIVDISAIPKEIWLPRLERADAIMVGGGNPYHLLYWMKRSGLLKIFKDLIKEKVYVGCSAGSTILGKTLISTAPKKYIEEIPEFEGNAGLGYIDFTIRPHFYNPDRPQFTDDSVQELASELDTTIYTIYAIDDNTGIAIENNEIEVISKGKWKKFERI
ncbi:MAG: Type 1 glutamine amidotransferase-like domain-containing protein [bacterium]